MNCRVCNTQSSDFMEMRDANDNLVKVFYCDECGSFSPEYEIDFDKSTDIKTAFHDDYFKDDFNKKVYDNLVLDLVKLVKFLNNKVSFKNKIISEVGAGRGLLVKAIKDENYKVLACEPSKVQCDLAEKILGLDKSEMANCGVNEFLESLKKRDINIDVFVLWHVIEHVDNPIKVFSDLVKNINLGGHIILQIPMLHKEYLYREHYFFWTKNTTDYFEKRFNLELVFQEVYVKEFFITCIFKKKHSNRLKQAERKINYGIIPEINNLLKFKDEHIKSLKEEIINLDGEKKLVIDSSKILVDERDTYILELEQKLKELSFE